jgi:hypothetical protein
MGPLVKLLPGLSFEGLLIEALVRNCISFLVCVPYVSACVKPPGIPRGSQHWPTSLLGFGRNLNDKNIYFQNLCLGETFATHLPCWTLPRCGGRGCTLIVRVRDSMRMRSEDTSNSDPCLSGRHRSAIWNHTPVEAEETPVMKPLTGTTPGHDGKSGWHIPYVGG